MVPVSMLLTIGVSAENDLLIKNFCNSSFDHVLALAQSSYTYHEAVADNGFEYEQPAPKKSYKIKAKIIQRKRGLPTDYE